MGRRHFLRLYVKGRPDIVDVLLMHPHIDLDVTNRLGEAALLLAMKRENIPIVERLLQGPKIPYMLALPADVSRCCKDYGKGALMENKIS
jgi:ankyrin repeat protein